MARQGEFLVIGLGRFGSGLAGTLVGMGREVLGVDADPKAVQALSGLLTHTVETVAPRELVGKTLAEAEVRRRYGITVVCAKPQGGSFT